MSTDTIVVLESGIEVLSVEVPETSVTVIETGLTTVEVVTAGPQGPAGPAGPAGNAYTYVHNQLSASLTWTINHNLSKFPSVVVFDSSGNEHEPSLSYVDNNTLILGFSSLITGIAYLN